MVAAMAIGAYAVPTYDFTASVKTTTAKSGKQTTTYTVNLGLNSSGVYWWEDLGFANDKEAKAYVSKLSNDEKAQFAYTKCGFNGVDTTYNVKELYKCKLVWCYTYKFKVVDEDCYRTAKAQTIKGEIIIDNCCSDSGWKFSDETMEKYADVLSDKNIGLLLLAKCGSMLDNKANTVEFAAEIGDFSTGEAGNWSLCGQGKWNAKCNRIDSISGNIVGFLPGPKCESCCSASAPAICFECDGNGNIVSPTYDLPTVAFGTWSIKYNAKKSN
jgi:hypothetical protein